MPGGTIFISYRRSDSQWAASRLFDTLSQVFPDERLFMDVDSIAPGQDFVDVLAEQVGRCDVFLALIGPDWLTETNPDGMRRIDDAQDFVRIEIASALEREDTVTIPVLLDGAAVPTESDLPAPLQPLARRQFARLTHEGYRGEIERLVDGIRQALAAAPPPEEAPEERPPRRPKISGRAAAMALAGLGIVAAAAAGVWFAMQPPDPSGNEDLAEFRECEACPAMIVIPAGAFDMGAPADEPKRLKQEGPVRRVEVQRFAIARTEVTFAEWDACVADGGCASFSPSDHDHGRGDNPAFNLSWDDVQSYIQWLNDQVPGDPYRLPSEAEWEYAARAGTTSAYHWGDAPDRAHANMGREICCIGAAEGADRWVGPAPVAQFPPNAFGLYDTAGNVWEWVADVYRNNYEGAPTDGGEWTSTSVRPGARRVLRGGSYMDRPWQVRSAMRISNSSNWRLNTYGFRPARTLGPKE